jgi:hypothetical protein
MKESRDGLGYKQLDTHFRRLESPLTISYNAQKIHLIFWMHLLIGSCCHSKVVHATQFSLQSRRM